MLLNKSARSQSVSSDDVGMLSDGERYVSTNRLSTAQCGSNSSVIKNLTV